MRHNRSDREIRIAAVLVVAVAFLLLVAAWIPLERSRTRLSAQLPALRASLETMQREADEARRLKAMPPAANQQAPVAALASSPPAGAQVTALDPKRVRLVAGDAAFGTLLDWLSAAQASHGLRVESARIEALAAPGRVKADIMMSRS